ncbi:MAG: zinc ribbon domain-containing protein [Arenicellales bacterium]|jgi:putative FmdB family regulatory protein
MPIYPYVCTECGHEFDALQKISDDPLTECPACGKPGLRKRLTAPAFKLKGTGWYETDFKHGNKDGKKGEKSEGGDGRDEKAGSGKDTAKTGSKEGTGAKSESSGGGSKPSATAGAKDD